MSLFALEPGDVADTSDDWYTLWAELKAETRELCGVAA